MNLKKIIKYFSDEIWNIGFVENDIDSVLQGEQLKVNWLKHNCKNSWFADPFILDYTESEIKVLVEEFYKPIHRGRISLLIIDKLTYELKKKIVILELPTHLSFPVIYRNNNDILIAPENGESGGFYIYRFDPKTNKCIKERKIIDEAIADPAMIQIDGDTFLFCTKPPQPNGNILTVYKKNKLNCFIPKETICFNENIARMAGSFFEYKGNLYRPAQECNKQYGHAVSIQKTFKNKSSFTFKEVQRLYSVHPTLNQGMHTFNVYKDLIVTDALGFHNMWIRDIIHFFGIRN